MKIHPAEQGSADWMIARAGIPTASEFDNLVTPDFKVRIGQMPQTYLAKKVAEAWQGGPLLGFNIFDAEQGKMLEEQARPWFELEYDTPIQRVGLITTDDGRIGCSPDGLIGDHSGIEIKCPAVHTHVGYLLNGELPMEYAAQMHGSLLVTGRQEWRFLSYRRHFPPLVLTIKRDNGIISRLEEAIVIFLTRFDNAMKRMEEINGGPPPRAVIIPAEEPQTLEDIYV